jgi:hypothetical protein
MSMTGLLAALLRYSVRALPVTRREWGEAVWAEADDVPAGRRRVRWLVGGLWLVAREIHALRRLLAVAAVGAACVAVVRFGWQGGSTNPGVAIERVHLLVMVSILIALPAFTRWRWAFGPVADSKQARLVRTFGYAAVCALLPVSIWLGRFAGARFDDHGTAAADLAQWHREQISGAVSGSIMLTALMTAYAVAILWLTSSRSAVAPSTLGVGAGTGAVLGLVGYALTPVGGLLVVSPFWLATICRMGVLTLAIGGPIVAGLLAARLASRHRSRAQGSRRPAGDPVRDALLAGVTAAAVAALLITLLTIPTMLLFPHQVHLKWANPDPDAPHGTPFEVEMSVGDTAARYEGLLFIAPFAGFLFGCIGAAADPEH